MESLNLTTLASSLPSQQNAEKELLNDFKGTSFTHHRIYAPDRLLRFTHLTHPTWIAITAAALSITTLYRSSRKTSKRAYNAGYAAACQDLLNFIQQGVSAGDVGQMMPAAGSSHAVEGGGLTIGRVMDWTEARVEAIRAREEEEDEDEEREKDKERTAPRGPAERPVGGHGVAKSEERKSAAVASSSSSGPSQRPKDTVSRGYCAVESIAKFSLSQTTSLPTPNSPVTHSSMHPPSLPSSPSPPPQATLACDRHRRGPVVSGLVARWKRRRGGGRWCW